MTTSSVDPTDQTYGVFINSNQSTFLSTQKSKVSIPFNGNLVDHDPTKNVSVALTSMLFTNTIYNITADNNNMNVLFYYAAGRDKPASCEEIFVTIPVGFYNITQLSNYLSKKDVLGYERVQALFLYGNIESFVNLFIGFGAIPQDPNDPIITKAAPTNDSNTKILLQTSDLAHMIQYGTDLTTAPSNGEDLEHSYIYEGVYIECGLEDVRYSPLLKMMGFFNINNAPPPEIELSKQQGDTFIGGTRTGYGLKFDAFEVKNSGPAYDNTVYYRIALERGEVQPVGEVVFTPTTFNGLIYNNDSVILTCAYELDPVTSDVVILTNGHYISGTGISIPSPYIVGFQDCTFEIALVVGSANFTVPALYSGFLSVGMAIGSTYDPVTLQPYDLNFANACDYNQGTIPAPGLENTQCFYIVSVNAGGLSGALNQPWSDAVTFTSTSALGTNYVLTTAQLSTPSILAEVMLSSPNSISGLSGILTPNNVTNMSGVDEIHVHCSQLRTKNLSSTYFQPLCPADVIAVIPVEVEFGFKQNYQPPNPLTSFLNNTNITSLDINLTDAKGEDLDFHGVDWSITLFVNETDAITPDEIAKGGNLNTPFQDQLATMEGTAVSQGKRMRPAFHFYEASQKRSGYGRR
jgi:hypothetical protein